MSKKLFLKNGRALSPKPGSLLFGDCRCGVCCPAFFLAAQIVQLFGVPDVGTVKVELTQYEWTGAGYVETSTSATSSSSETVKRTAAIVSHRKNDPCGIVAANGIADLSARARSWMGMWADAQVYVNGVHRGGRHLVLRAGLNATITNTSSAAYTWEREGRAYQAECNSCAKYHISYGALKTSGSEPSSIPKTRSYTVAPNEEALNIPGITLSETIAAGATSTFGMWWEWEFWLDAQYDQGLIVP